MVCVLVITCDFLSWDAMLSMTKVELDFIVDVDINLFFEKRKRIKMWCFLYF